MKINIGTQLHMLQDPYQMLKNDMPKLRRKLSIVFATKRFHEYIYGEKFSVINDHKPLNAIFEKSICNSPTRIQRIFILPTEI